MSETKKKLRPRPWRFVSIIFNISERSDQWLRRIDFRFGRSWGGIGKKFGFDGYEPITIALLFLLLFFLIFGPTGWEDRGLWAPGLWFLSCLISFIGFRYFIGWARNRKTDPAAMLANIVRNNAPLWSQMAVIFVIALSGLLLWLSGENHPVAEKGLYPHFLLAAIWVILIPLFIAPFLARWIYRVDPLRRTWLPILVRQVELFDRKFPVKSGRKIFRSLLIVPIHHFLALLFFPSVVLVFLVPNYLAPGRLGIFFTVMFLTFVVLGFANINAGFGTIFRFIDRFFLHGGQLIVSVLIIVFAAGLLIPITYLSTPVESARGTIFLFALATYSLFWFYEYWINRILSMEILGLFQSDQDRPGQAAYPADFKPYTNIQMEERVLQIHAGDRIIAVGQKADGSTAFQPYGPADLVAHIASEATEIADPKKERAARVFLKDYVKDIRKNSWFYFGVLNCIQIGLVVGLVLLGGIYHPEPGINVENTGDGHLPLDKKLFADKQPVVMIAASGGGTRAALYTTSVLYGLHGAGLLENVKLLSGVSGGGVALAYFAANRAELIGKDQASRVAWQKFFEKMGKPFIEDVFEGITEMRLLGTVRMGTLLAESFNRTLYQDAPRKTFGQVQDIGLILNSALAGSLEYDPEDPPLCGVDEFDAWVEANAKKTRSTYIGGRLVFTNLSGDFLAENKRLHDLRYVVVRNSETRLARASAMNANFPPVFTNSAVDIRCGEKDAGRYWVTDGGAVENRGLVSLLIALREAVQKKKQGKKPPLYIITADASATDFDFSQDRGISVPFGASHKFASQLINELYDDISAEYGSDKIHRYYLPMPAALRMRGGMGTHWMLPEWFRLSDPAVVPENKASAFSLTSCRTVRVVAGLFRNANETEASAIWPCAGQQAVLSCLFDYEENLSSLDDWIEKDVKPPYRSRALWKQFLHDIDPENNPALDEETDRSAAAAPEFRKVCPEGTFRAIRDWVWNSN